MGEGVCELDEAPEGEGIMDPSSDAHIVSTTMSDSSAPLPALCARGLEMLLSVAVRCGGRPAMGATRCFGARGGLLATGGLQVVVQIKGSRAVHTAPQACWTVSQAGTRPCRDPYAQSQQD